MRKRKIVISFSVIDHMETDIYKNLSLSFLDFFFVPILYTLFRLRGARWQVWIMMCWKAVKWRKGMTSLWWQKQKEDSVPDSFYSILCKHRRKKEEPGTHYNWRRGVKVTLTRKDGTLVNDKAWVREKIKDYRKAYNWFLKGVVGFKSADKHTVHTQ